MDESIPVSRDIKRIKLKFSLLQLTFWCSWCAFTSFAILLFRHEGLSDSQAGFAMALSTLAGIIGQAVWGYLCDRFNTIRKIFFIANLIIWAIILMFIFIRDPIPVMMLMGVLGFTQVPQPAILDSWILKKLPGRESDYGHIRLWASFGFAASALLFGKFINLIGYKAMFISASAFIAATLVVTLTVPDKEQNDKGGGKHLVREFAEIAKNKSFLFFLMACFIIGLAARTTHTLLPLIIEKVNGKAGQLGTALFLTGAAEIPMLILSKRLSKRLEAFSMILISVVFYLGQFIMLYLANTPTLVFAAAAFQGLAFGNFLPSVRLFVYGNAPKNLRTSAQTLTDGVVSSLAGVIGSAAGGVIIQNSGVHSVVLICLALTAAAGLVLLGKLLFRKR